ncbi:hypothetical protein [Kitasatospora sp. NPDC056731]|uniref:hypothetical protein n=1 Tax=Kitasatospora sp. NPDC056731 TaxID=3155422 RepID=UPI0034201D50
MAPSAVNPKPAPAALTGLLPDDAPYPIRFERFGAGVIAAFSPAQIKRSDAWAVLTGLFGDLLDVTPEAAR